MQNSNEIKINASCKGNAYLKELSVEVELLIQKEHRMMRIDSTVTINLTSFVN